MDKSELTGWIKTKAAALGFVRCGVAAADYLDQEAPRLQRWLAEGMNGEMGYLGERVDVRLDPRRLLPGARSVICLAHGYYTNRRQLDPKAPRISKYAQGADYHRVLRQKTNLLLEQLRYQIGDFQSAAAVDSGACLEKAWGARAGIGWVGKNSLIMHRDTGSFIFLALAIVDFELDYDQPLENQCAACKVCIDACPTGAIVRPHVVDARKCIAYATIEVKQGPPAEFKGKMTNWAFGCDICQDVCPWNRRAALRQEQEFQAPEEFYRMWADDWWQLTPETFRRLFQGTPMARGGYARLKRNLDFL